MVARPISPDDAAALQQGMMTLGSQSRFLRFHAHRNDVLSDHELHYFTHCDQYYHLALVLHTDSKQEQGIGVCRCVRDLDDPSVAEMAITIADEWQQQGAGVLLARELVRICLEVGITRWTAYYLVTNRGIAKLMQHVAKLTAIELVGNGEVKAFYQLAPSGAPAAESVHVANAGNRPEPAPKRAMAGRLRG